MKKEIIKKKTLYSISFMLVLVAWSIAYASFMFIDLTNTADNSTIFMQSFCNGRFFNFYEDSVLYASTNFSANYSALTYIILGIWQIPFILISRVNHVVYAATWYCLLWTKALTVLLLCGTIYVSARIVQFITNNKTMSRYCVLLIASGMFVFFPVFIEGQIDILPLFLMLIGLYGYITNNRKLFILSFIFATTIKTYCLFMSLPLLLLKEKNLFKAVILWLSTLSLLIIEKILFINSNIYSFALGSQSRDAIGALLGSSTPVGRPLLAFIAIYAIIVVVCILIKNATAITSVYVSLCVWISFIALSYTNEGWFVLLAPFVAIMICCSDVLISFNMILETIAGVAYFMYEAVAGGIFVDNDLISRLILPIFITIPDKLTAKYSNLNAFCSVKHLDQYCSLFATGFVVALVLIAVLVNPSIQKILRKYDIGNSDSELEKSNSWIIVLRPLAMLAACAVIIYVYTSTVNPLVISTFTYEEYVAEYDLLSEDRTCLSQKLSFSDNRELDSLVLLFDNPFYSRANMSQLVIELWNLTTNECIYSTCYGSSYIVSDERFELSLNGVEVNDSDSYEIRLSGIEGVPVLTKLTSLYPYIINQSDIGNSPYLECLEVNGVPTDCYLCFEVR